MNFNKVIIMGRLTKDPETRFANSGSVICSFSIAVNEKYKKDGQNCETVSFIDIVTFGKTADNCKQFIKKGNCVLVEGKLKQERWEKEGRTMSKITVQSQSVTFMPKSTGHKPTEVNQNDQTGQTNQAPTPNYNGDDVPF